MPDPTAPFDPATRPGPPPTAGDLSTHPGPPADPVAVPETVGRYEIVGEIARGGMGAVYRARDPQFDRDVAVKRMHAPARANPAAARRFLDEARITGQLQHPGIPPVHEVGDLPGVGPFLAMKLIKGRTLDDLLKDRPDPAHDRGRFLAVFEAVCQAVGYAHAHEVIHRDLKPANVMVGAFGEVQVMDWGLAKVLAGGGRPAAGSDPDATLGTEINSLRSADQETQAGSVLGTPAYMPPEQAIGAVDEIDRRSDVFGLGAVLCAILTGSPPYRGTTAEDTRKQAARAKLDDALTRLAACGAEPALVALCKRCLAADRADRPADAGEVAAAVAKLRADADERARVAVVERVAAEVRVGEGRKRRRVWVVLALVLLAGAAASAGLAAWAYREADRANETLTNLESARFETVTALRKLTDQTVGDVARRQTVVSDRDRQFIKDVQSLWEKVAAGRGYTPQAEALRAECALRVGVLHSRLGEWTDADRAYRNALTMYEKLVAEHPAVPRYQERLADTHHKMGLLFAATGRPADAEREYQIVRSAYQKLAADRPAVRAYQNDLAGVLVNMAILRLDENRPDVAKRLLEEAVPLHRAALADFPQDPDYCGFLCNNRVNLCLALIALADHAAVPPVAAEVLEYSTDSLTDTYAAACFLARCVPLALADPKLDPPANKQLAAKYADRAMAYLRKAVELGYTDAAHMRTDDDLFPLRQRIDFRQLLARLEGQPIPCEAAPPPRPVE